MRTSTTQTSLGTLTKTFAAHTHLGSIVVSVGTQTRKAMRVDREALTKIRSKASSPTRYACMLLHATE